MDYKIDLKKKKKKKKSLCFAIINLNCDNQHLQSESVRLFAVLSQSLSLHLTQKHPHPQLKFYHLCSKFEECLLHTSLCEFLLNRNFLVFKSVDIQEAYYHSWPLASPCSQPSTFPVPYSFTTHTHNHTIDNSLDLYSPKDSIMLPMHLSTRLLVAHSGMQK